VILARTDALIHGWEEVEARVREFIRIGVDFVFIEAMPDRETMQRAVKAFDIPLMANIIEGGKTENLSAGELGAMGFAMVAYPITLVAAHLKGARAALKGLKESLKVGPPPLIMSFEEVCEGVGFNKYWDEEIRYTY
jgi:2-methylisocitrate lyase-like PEP mutase family enzyme